MFYIKVLLYVWRVGHQQTHASLVSPIVWEGRGALIRARVERLMTCCWRTRERVVLTYRSGDVIRPAPPCLEGVPDLPDPFLPCSLQSPSLVYVVMVHGTYSICVLVVFHATFMSGMRMVFTYPHMVFSLASIPRDHHQSTSFSTSDFPSAQGSCAHKGRPCRRLAVCLSLYGFNNQQFRRRDGVAAQQSMETNAGLMFRC